ncbi:GNAT family N-acetyltransferase [Halovenus rubra]|uniref:GNAT family N-acetyltransferase n=2 Tax=Halovenus rubra TaxID=869890 RepID=A0ABD5X0B8_9EURY|nr:GNAT family N-acetyltransferase [Halovenus rubra]
MSLIVRDAAPEDAPAIRDVHLASIEGLAGQSYADEQVAAWAHDRDPDEYPIDSPETRFLVAEKAPHIVGLGWMRVDADDYLQCDADGEITAVYVHPTVAREGVGSQLYNDLEAAAQLCGVESLGLWASRNAVPFYAKEGYERVTEHVHEFDERVEATVVEMYKPLDK